MKKIFLSLCIFLSFLLSACGEEKPTKNEDFSVEGNLKSLGNFKVSENITHIIETRSGDVIYAYSEKYNLDDQKYKTELLLFEGTLHYFESFDRPQFEIDSIRPSEKIMQDLPEEWEQNTNEEIGLTYDSLNIWIKKNLQDGVKYEALNDDAYLSIQLETTSASEPSEWVAEKKPEWMSFNPDRILFGDEIQGLEYQNAEETLLVFMREDMIYHIQAKWNTLDLSKSHYMHFLQSLTMVPFLEHMGSESVAPQQMPEMSLVESMGLQFEYPKTWYYQGDQNGFRIHDEEINSINTEVKIHLTKNPSSTKAFHKSKSIQGIVWTIEADNSYEAIANYILNSMKPIIQ